MNIEKLIERKKNVEEERIKINEKIVKAQGIIASATQQINELIGLLNVNQGILSEIDYNIKSLTPDVVQVEEEAKALQ